MKWPRAMLPLLCVAGLMSAVGQEPGGSPETGSTADASGTDATQVVAKAVTLYRDGQYEAALGLLRAELSEGAGEELPQMRLNASLSALRLLYSRDAEELVAPLAEDERWGADAAFLLALASSQHAERAVVAAKLADAEPMAWVMATRAIQAAELQFRRAVMARPDWPEAVRNLERTIRRRRQIEAEREAAKPKESKKEDAPKPEPPKPPKDQEQPPEVVIPEVAAAELTAKELAELQQRVREQQRKKVTGRQQRSRRGSPRGRDW